MKTHLLPEISNKLQRKLLKLQEKYSFTQGIRMSK